VFPIRSKSTAGGSPWSASRPSRKGRPWSSCMRDSAASPRFLHDEALVTLPRVLELADIEDAFLVGHSDGASIALIFAGANPGMRLQRVIAEAPHLLSRISPSPRFARWRIPGEPPICRCASRAITAKRRRRCFRRGPACGSATSSARSTFAITSLRFAVRSWRCPWSRSVADKTLSDRLFPLWMIPDRDTTDGFEVLLSALINRAGNCELMSVA
jgi:pimeloyl-ACP methyl ester carboxylesterase